MTSFTIEKKQGLFVRCCAMLCRCFFVPEPQVMHTASVAGKLGHFVALPALPIVGAFKCLGCRINIRTGWWFQIFFIFTPTCGNDPI